MQVSQSSSRAALEDPTDVIGVPLSVLFAEGEALEAVRSGASTSLKLEPPYHLSDDNRYLVLPDDIGMEIVDIMHDHDLDLLHEAMRDGLLVDGEAVEGDDQVTLEVARQWTPRAILKAPSPTYRSQILIGPGIDPLEEINALPQLRITIASKLFDDEGLDRSMRKRESVGISWRSSPMDALGLGGMDDDELGGGPGVVDPTYAWTKRIEDGRVGVEFALFKEYEELVALLRPLELRFRL